MPTLTTDRLVIRELEDFDAAAVRALTGFDEAWLRWTTLGYAQLAELHQPPYGDRAVALRDTGEVVGLAGYVPMLAPFGLLPSWPWPAQGFTAEVGLFYAIGAEHRRRGYAAEAATALVQFGFAGLQLARIVATTERSNAGSIGVMQRLGMRLDQNPHPDPDWFQVVGWVSGPASR